MSLTVLAVASVHTALMTAAVIYIVRHRAEWKPQGRNEAPQPSEEDWGACARREPNATTAFRSERG
jgi:hypothetical protein